MDNLKEKGAQILEALAMAGKKQSLADQIKEKNILISRNNAEVAKLQKEMDANNNSLSESIDSLAKELGEVSSALATALAVLEKEGYKLPIGEKKGSKSVSL